MASPRVLKQERYIRMRQFRKAKVDRAAHCHPLVRFLFREADKQCIGLQDLGERAGLGKHTIRDWSRRRQPGIANLDAALQVLGYKLEIARDVQSAEAVKTPAPMVDRSKATQGKAAE